MSADAEPISPMKRRIQSRKTRILAVARELLLQHGYFGMTMDAVASATGYPKGTIYLQFGCKEDVILALATECLERRLAMIHRGAAYPGKTRERAVAVGEAVSLFARLYPDDSRIIHIATGPVREKGDETRLETVRRLESETVAVLYGILMDAIRDGELIFKGDATVEEMAFALCAFIEGGYTLIEGEFPQHTLGIEAPILEMWWVFNRLADAYGWRPYFMEWDWEETLADVRQHLFPEEAQRVYGRGSWYGDIGAQHPGVRRRF